MSKIGETIHIPYTYESIRLKPKGWSMSSSEHENKFLAWAKRVGMKVAVSEDWQHDRVTVSIKDKDGSVTQQQVSKQLWSQMGGSHHVSQADSGGAIDAPKSQAQMYWKYLNANWHGQVISKARRASSIRRSSYSYYLALAMCGHQELLEEEAELERSRALASCPTEKSRDQLDAFYELDAKVSAEGKHLVLSVQGPMQDPVFTAEVRDTL